MRARSGSQPSTRLFRAALLEVMCLFEIPVFKYISSLWTKRGYSLVGVLWFAEFATWQGFLELRLVLGDGYWLVPSAGPCWLQR